MRLIVLGVTVLSAVSALCAEYITSVVLPDGTTKTFQDEGARQEIQGILAQKYLKPESVMAGDNVSVTTNAAGEVTISADAEPLQIASGTYIQNISYAPLYDGSTNGSLQVSGCYITNLVLNATNGYPQSLTVHLNGTICGRVFDNEEIALTSENPTLNEAKATIEDESGKYYLLYSTELHSDVLTRPYKGFVYIYRLNPTAQMTMYSFTECRDLSRVISEVDTKPYKDHDKSLISSKAVYDATSDKLKLTGGELKGSLTFDFKDLNSLLGWQYPKYNLVGPRYIETGLANDEDDSVKYYAGMSVCEPDINETKFKFPAALWVKRISIKKPISKEMWVYDQYGIAYEKMVSSNDITQTVTATRLAFPTNSSGVMLGGTLARTEDIATAITNKADKTALDTHVNNTNNPHSVTAKQIGAVPLVADVNSNKTAVTIGSRNNNKPVGESSFANGNYVTASGAYSHAEGWDGRAQGDLSHAEGSSTTASGVCAHAEGMETTASGDYSHAEGAEARASGECAHAEGNATRAIGKFSHAEGHVTEADGDYAHAEGVNTSAGAEGSHSAGCRAHVPYKHLYAFAWNGDPTYGIEEGEAYFSHGPGTYNINPIGGLEGFWIGDKTLLKHIADVVPEPGNYAAVSNAAMKALANTETLAMESNEVEIVNESIPFFLGAVNFTYTSGMFTVNPTNWPNYKSTFIFGTVADGIQFASNIMFSGFVNSNETVVPASATTIPRGSKWYGNIRRIGSNYYVEYIGVCE